MLLAIDIGNSSIKFGIFDDDDLTDKFSIPTRRDYTADEIALEVGGRIPSAIEASIACSVVPEVEETISVYLKSSFHIEPRFVRSTDELGFRIDFSVETTGTDRLVNCFGAAEKYGVPCIVVSFGTATTIDVVNRDREYLGGLIAPGMKVSAEALSIAASKLPEVKIQKPDTLIARTTETAIQSGIVFGQIAMVEGLLKRLVSQIGDSPKVIATGGFAGLIEEELVMIEVVDTDLTLRGLNIIQRRN
jgi:type III pantothenate kinase